MRTRLGWAVSVLGVLLALLGAAVMVALGPDSRFSTGPHRVRTDGIAVVTAPRTISWADVQVDLLAEVPVRKPVFIGLGNSVDVQDFVGRTERLEITRFQRPWTLTSREVKGRPNLPGAPTAVDWWIDQSAGLGGASISTRLPDESVSIAVLAVGSTNLSGLKITLAYGVEGGFYKGLGVLLLGAALVWTGVLVRRVPAAASELVETEEVVYVYVDENGVEHELSAEEAGAYEVVEERVDEVEVDQVAAEPDPDPDPRPRPAVEPLAAAPRVPGVATAGEIAAAEPEPVIYVYVDEDGVEHEVSEDELSEFEVVDEEDES